MESKKNDEYIALNSSKLADGTTLFLNSVNDRCSTGRLFTAATQALNTFIEAVHQ